jgi:hypothetical protein
MGAKSWRLADLGAKHAQLLAGVGWGNMPEPIVRDDLAAGRSKLWIFPMGPAASIIWRQFIAPTNRRAPQLPG